MIKDISKMKLSTNMTIGQYVELLKDNELSKAAIAGFVFERLTERYIVPNEHVPTAYKNGFSIMANCCLLIETYQCFREGLMDTNKSGEGKRVFENFFNNESLFLDLIGMGDQFYWNIRCGILHQGETKKGWSISRHSKDPLFEKKTLKINANLFLSTLRKVLINYKTELEVEDWTGTLWTNCRGKIQFILDNCNGK